MKFTNSKTNIKNLGNDFKDALKSNGKVLKDLCLIFPSLTKDVKVEHAYRKAFNKAYKEAMSQNTLSEGGTRACAKEAQA